MNDPLQDYLRKHRPPITPAPSDEWERILKRTQKDGRRRQRRVWYYASAATLAAAGMIAFLNFKPSTPEADAGLEAEDVMYQVDTQDPGTYQDWLLIADQVVEEAGE